MSGVNKGEVSRLCAELDGKIEASYNRPVEAEYPYVWLDGDVKVREGDWVVNMVLVGVFPDRPSLIRPAGDIPQEQSYESAPTPLRYFSKEPMAKPRSVRLGQNQHEEGSLLDAHTLKPTLKTQECSFTPPAGTRSTTGLPATFPPHITWCTPLSPSSPRRRC
ncbi:MAG: transposase [Bacillota bacterium]